MLTDHPSPEELLAVVRGGLAPERERAILRHLYQGCETCLAAAPSALAASFGQEGKPTPEEEAATDAAIDRAFAVALSHNRHLRGQERQAKRAGKILAAGGMEAPEKLPKLMGQLAKYFALLDRSWSLRHEDTESMVYFARLAVQCAERLKPQQYGIERVFDFKCHAQAELGNALRVSDQLDNASTAFYRARQLFELGTHDKALEAHLLDFEASLDADCRRFKEAAMRLEKVYRFHWHKRDHHLAGRALVRQALYMANSGKQVKALEILQEGLTLVDANRDPVLAYAAKHNEVTLLVDCGRFKEARNQLFLLRPQQKHHGGRINKLRFRWEEGRIDAGLERFQKSEEALREVQAGFLEVNRAYDSALASLDLSAVLLAQSKSHKATAVVVAAYKMFIALKIQREAVMAVLVLKTACELHEATREMAEKVAKYVRRLENDPNAQFEGIAWDPDEE